MRILSIFTIVSAVLYSAGGYSQDHQEETHHHDKNEISIAAGVVPLFSEEKVAAGIHLHYVRGVGANNRFGVGAALETILDVHRHYTIAVLFEYRIYKGFILGYAPGVLIKKEEAGNEIQFAQHIEAAYEFELGQFHLGPMAEVGIEKMGTHFMAGIHLGFDF